jgi:hypothetical protein
MKNILSILALFFTAGLVQAQDAVELTAQPPGPFIAFTESSHDFGDIEQGDVVQYIFEFENKGDAPVVLADVRTTCGCTASEWVREPIAPGASAKIKVTFNSSGKIGRQNKVVTIMSNAANNPERVSIVTNVLPKPPADQ